jgi:tol-pal system protein YbgF
MDLIAFKAGHSLLKYFSIALLVAGLAFFNGCGVSEEAMTEEDEFGMSEEMEEEVAEEEESADQQALTSFIGAKPKEETPPPPVETAPPPTATLEAQMEELRTENTSLKQQLVKLEQDNRMLGAQLSETEAKLMAEKERADKAETAPTGITRGADMTAYIPAPVEPVPVSATAYDDALQSFRSKRYDEAVVKFQSLLDGGVAANLADNCHYWLGESNYGKRNYAEAIGHFERVFEYKKSEKYADAQFMIAQSYERLKEKAKAKEAYEKVVKEFPTSRLVGKAKVRWARL